MLVVQRDNCFQGSFVDAIVKLEMFFSHAKDETTASCYANPRIETQKLRWFTGNHGNRCNYDSKLTFDVNCSSSGH